MDKLREKIVDLVLEVDLERDLRQRAQKETANLAVQLQLLRDQLDRCVRIYPDLRTRL